MTSPQKEQYTLQSLPLIRMQNVGYRIDGDRVHLTFDRIENNRQQAAISGTLSIELWALPEAYQGGLFSGTPLAGTQIGQLSDNCYLEACHYDLCFAEPAAGEWSLCVMLREWNGTAFDTLDYVNFSLPFVVAEPVDERGMAKPDGQKVIEVDFSRPEKEIPAARTMPAKEAVKNKAEPPKKTAQAKAPVVKAPAKPASKKVEVAVVNLNTASLKEIEAVNGLSKKLAKQIVEERPFASIDRLLKVKGMGPKLLAKIKQHVSL
jgi:competence ComEA-like helix-hairpin-helix protein